MTAPLNGLVLAGGKSSRMGQDKAFIKWHGKEQCYHLAELLKNVCGEVFISCNEKQKNKIDKSYSAVVDRYKEAGPMAGLLSAFETNNICAWLLVACDHPLLDLATIQHLISQRDESCLVTALKDSDGIPHPLLAIWEPQAFDLLKKEFYQGRLSLKKVLEIKKSKLIAPPNAEIFFNINSPADMTNFLLQKSSSTK